MKIMTCVFALGLTLNTFAGQVITKYKTIEALSQSYLRNPIYLKKRFGKDVRIKAQDLGVLLTPYYTNRVGIHKDYKSFLGQCYTTTQYENKTIVRKSKCTKRNLYIIVDGNRYDQIDNLEKYVNNEIEFNKQSYSKTIEAFHHTKYDFDNDTTSTNRPFSLVNIKLDSFKRLSVSDSSIVVDTNIKQSRSKYTFFPQRVLEASYKLRFELNKSDMVFSDGDEKLILLKRYQPSVLRFTAASLSDLYIDYLNNLEDHLFTYQDSKRCFRDNTFAKSKYDCDTVVFKNKSAIQIVRFDYVSVDFKTSEVIIK